MRIDSGVDLAYLKYFRAVARAGGFSRASRELGVQQPSITRGVQKLEEQLGVALFERSGKSVRLTRAGHQILAACERVFDEARAIRAIAEAESSSAGACSGPLRFAAANPVSTGLVPRALERLARRHPDVWPQVFVGAARELTDRIATADLEFGLFFYVPHLPDGLQRATFARPRFRLVAATKCRDDRAVLARFIGSREIEDPGTERFPALERWRQREPNARLAISTNDVAAHRELALRGLGVAVLPDFLVRDDLKARRLIDLWPREELRFGLKLVTRKGGIFSRPARAFMDELGASIQD